MTRTRVVIFAKAPVPGEVKTRLIPALGDIGAARLAHQMLLASVTEAVEARLAVPEICMAPHPLDPDWANYLPKAEARFTDQGEGGLGDRLARAAKRVIGFGEHVLLTGTDCPGLDRHNLRAAAQALSDHDAVIHPTLDGGYALLGLRRFDASLFSDIAWSSDSVAAATIARIEALGWSLLVGETLRDIDEPEDLAASGMI